MILGAGKGRKIKKYLKTKRNEYGSVIRYACILAIVINNYFTFFIPALCPIAP